MKKNQAYRLMVGILIAVVLILLFLPTLSDQDAESSFEPETHEEVRYSNLSSKNKPNYETSITLNAIGDILVHQPVYDDAKTADGYNFKPMFEPVKSLIENADITIANQETILGGTELGLSSYPSFNSPYEVADALQYVGVDIVSMANNHTLDRGEQAIMNATNYLNEIGIEYVGSYRNEEDRNTPRILTKKDISVGFLSYTYGTNGIPVPDGKDYLVNYIDQEKILTDIEKLQDKTDFIVVSMHFGAQYEPLPNDEQIYLTDLLTSNGADVIIGHHPHVLQPVDWISSQDGHDRFVMYSLGNFLSNQTGLERNIGVISQIKLTKKRLNNEMNYQVSDAQMIPTYNYSENNRDFKIVPLSEAGQYGLQNSDQIYKDTINHLQSFTDQVDFPSGFETVQ
ncbi:CapA family protein [Allobacillus sp. GCM10007491]|uniref:CapA family protein n=1 Tax=Allobacillus saliphilus TaxID=2912308 RepID=A0A941CUW8_9BACI|nr:CapA family protein [Allobacillus saliphilus]